ncbi:hypothetical protein [uncultured Ruegeria sp.]|uniref:hypothetical protein n=1 Tax=uncultured Ruegeria sp. TaxID=259304 RepID=UPI002608A6E1|nr:hypothetical protein [uncultured Ruegeria sp.]
MTHRTLEALNVQPGDVVRYTDGGTYSVAADMGLVSHQTGEFVDYSELWNTHPSFTVVCRSADLLLSRGGS